MRAIVLLGITICIVVSIYKKDYFKLTNMQTIVLLVYALAMSQVFNRIIYFISYGSWGGHFFYGAALCMPLYLIPIVLLFKLNYLRTTDHIALVAIFMSAFGDLDCWLVSHCCGGMALFEMSNGEIFYFPSQVAEMIVQYIILFILIKLSRNPKTQGILFGWFFILYGIQRMGFDYLREIVPVHMFDVVRPATFWCTILVIWGILWVIFVPKTKACQQLREQTAIDRANLAEEVKINKIRKQKQKQAKQKSK